MPPFRDRLRGGELIAATWIKTPHPHVVEVLAHAPFDALVIDAEHAPFDRAALDLAILAGRAGDMPILVRPASADPALLLQALDGGADGVVVPHVRSAAEAEAIARACHYTPGGRGYAGSTRAAGYTTIGMAAHRSAAKAIAVIAQIEDAEALDNIEAIAAVDTIDALFIGRADLTVSLGAASPDDAVVVDAVERICAAARGAGRTVGMFLARPADVPQWRERGASLFILGSDQEFLLRGAAALADQIRA